jgi:hypothetical protein
MARPVLPQSWFWQAGRVDGQHPSKHPSGPPLSVASANVPSTPAASPLAAASAPVSAASRCPPHAAPKRRATTAMFSPVRTLEQPSTVQESYCLTAPLNVACRLNAGSGTMPVGPTWSSASSLSSVRSLRARFGRLLTRALRHRCRTRSCSPGADAPPAGRHAVLAAVGHRRRSFAKR